MSEDFLKLASAKNGLIYPVEEERRTLGQDQFTQFTYMLRMSFVILLLCVATVLACFH